MSTIKPKFQPYQAGDVELNRVQERIRRALADMALQIDADVSLLLNQLGATRGSILFRSATGWKILGPGLPGQLLTTNGVGADPSWT